MSGRGFLSLLGGALLVLGTDAHARPRTVHFAGSSNIPYLTSGFSSQARYGYCTVVVSNLGSTSQKITKVEFLQTQYSGSNISSSMVSISGVNDQFMVQPTAAASTATTAGCIDQSLPSNGYCVFVKRINTVAVGGIRNISCSGRITVEDVTASQPGSVLASGSVVTLQESVVLGGILSAAHYYGTPNFLAGNAGNARFDDLPTNKPTGVTTLSAPTSGGGTGQMNLSCYAACKNSIASTVANRELLCEGYCGYMGPIAPGDKYLGDYPVTPSPSPTAPMVPGFDYSSSYAPDTLVFNSLYSGGIVHEMIMGPFLSICSGNKSYKEEGGTEFSHAEVGLGVLEAMDASGGIPERLHCVHRHGMEDLYSRVGSTSAFAINGGSPF